MIYLIISYLIITWGLGKIIYEVEIPDLTAWIGAALITSPIFLLVYN